jgi:hypothetical protein
MSRPRLRFSLGQMANLAAWTGVVGAAVGATAALASTWVASRATRQEGQADREHQTQMANEERVMSHRADAYLELFQDVLRVDLWVQWVQTVDVNGLEGNESAPNFTESDRWFQMFALTKGFGSSEVDQEFLDLSQMHRAIIRNLEDYPPPADGAAATHMSDQGVDASIGTRKELCESVTKLAGKLQERMASELKGDVDRRRRIAANTHRI